MAQRKTDGVDNTVATEASKKIPKFTRKQALVLVLTAMIIAAACYIVPPLLETGDAPTQSLDDSVKAQSENGTSQASSIKAEDGTDVLQIQANNGSQVTVENAKDGETKRKVEKIEQDLERQRLEKQQEEQRKQEEAARKATTLIRIEITLNTTRDDKDDQDVVHLAVLKGDRVVGTTAAFGGNKLDDDSTHSASIRISPPAIFQNDFNLKIRKTGTDGWIFHVQEVRGVFEDNSVRVLHGRSGELHYEDDYQEAPPFALRR